MLILIKTLKTAVLSEKHNKLICARQQILVSKSCAMLTFNTAANNKLIKH